MGSRPRRRALREITPAPDSPLRAYRSDCPCSLGLSVCQNWPRSRSQHFARGPGSYHRGVRLGRALLCFLPIVGWHNDARQMPALWALVGYQPRFMQHWGDTDNLRHSRCLTSRARRRIVTLSSLTIWHGPSPGPVYYRLSASPTPVT